MIQNGGNVSNFYRSWPSERDWIDRDLGRIPHIVDDLPKLIISDHNYKFVSDHNSLQTLDGWPNDNFAMLEWDIALDPIAQRTFWAQAMVEPNRILVAPYRFHDSWCQWIGNDGSGPTVDGRAINVGETETDSIGLGCIYIPRVMITEFLAIMDKFGFTDATFGKWSRQKYGPARVTWDVHPQHIHDYHIT